MKKYLLLICLSLPMLAFADTPRGEKLTHMLWKDIQAKRVKKIAHYTSKGFVALSSGGILTRTQYLDDIKEALIPKYKLSGLQVTQGKNVIIVTYIVCLSGDIEKAAVVIAKEQASQMIDVWKKVDNEWKLTAEGSVVAGIGSYATVPVVYTQAE
jgi:hypothetical protein